MKIVFDPNQDYQKQAVDSVIKLFNDQPIVQSEYTISPAAGSLAFSEKGVANKLVISSDAVKNNLKSVQTINSISKVDSELFFVKYSDQKDEETTTEITAPFYNFTVEMETGTGKTYVYIRTIFELNKVYGFKKFVIVVPSVPIREGVLKNLEITEEHFKQIYNNVPFDYFVYDSSKVSQLRGFASSNNIQILVISIDSFTKDINIINNPNDKLNGLKPIEFIQNTNPIVIMDEPQNMETDIRKKAIHNLNPLFTLRYSATHKYLYNLIYSLNPVAAYDLGLVKQIVVDSVYSYDEYNNAYINLIDTKATKTTVSAKVEIFYNKENTAVKKKINVKNGDDLYELSNNREIYKEGYIINEIDVSNNSVTFSKGLTVQSGRPSGSYSDDIMKFQVQQAIEEHLKKELRFKEKGIKVLSLFFIDKVANYRFYDENGNTQKGKFAEWFEEIYDSLSKKKIYDTLSFPNVEKVHNGYFAQDKNGKFKDSSETRETIADVDTYSLIMKEKERLLDINEPLKFIFSHSALREGWDNPNVFQICTLNETESKMKKRQEIGRGMRLPVDQNGERIFDKSINQLTIIANESYDDFAKNLQKEYEDDCNVNFEGRIKNNRDRVEVKYKKGLELDDKFKAIWDKIKHKTFYKVEYSSSELTKAASKKISEMPQIRKPTLVAEKHKIIIDDKGVDSQLAGISKIEIENNDFKIPDILTYIQNHTNLTRITISEILKQSKRLNDIFVNPQLFIESVTTIIKDTLIDFLIDGIEYHKIGDKFYEMHLFEDKQAFKDSLLYELKNNSNTIHDNYIQLDSNIEMKFAEDCEENENVEMYFKLPFWFKINTPIGTYNPDWALIYKNDEKVYFVAETKDVAEADKVDNLRIDEQRKIKCARKHFEKFEDVKYKVVKDIGQL